METHQMKHVSTTRSVGSKTTIMNKHGKLQGKTKWNTRASVHKEISKLWLTPWHRRKQHPIALQNNNMRAPIPNLCFVKCTTLSQTTRWNAQRCHKAHANWKQRRNMQLHCSATWIPCTLNCTHCNNATCTYMMMKCGTRTLNAQREYAAALLRHPYFWAAPSETHRETPDYKSTLDQIRSSHLEGHKSFALNSAALVEMCCGYCSNRNL